MDNVFVTGANGLLGTNLILTLLEQRYTVVALVRKKNSFIKPNLKNLTLIEGNLNNKIQLAQQMKDCKYVVHIAADTSQYHLKLNHYYSTNVLGTQNIVDACIQNKIEKLVFIGSANTYGYGSLNSLGNEEKPMKNPFTKSLYAISKKQAQEIIDSAAKRLNVTTISPTFMIGSFDTKPSSGKIILRALNKRLVFYPSGGKNFVHVSDVALSIIKAFDIQEFGEKFIIANENLSFKHFYQKLFAINHQKTRLILVPNFLLKLLGLVGDGLRLLSIRTEISSVNTSLLRINNYYTNDKAKEKLDITFSSTEQAIKDALDYFNNSDAMKK